MEQFYKFNRSYSSDGGLPKLTEEQIQAIADYIQNCYKTNK